MENNTAGYEGSLAMTSLRLLWLRYRESVLEGEVEHGEMLIREHRARLQLAYRHLRQVRERIAMQTPAHSLIKHLLRRQA